MAPRKASGATSNGAEERPILVTGTALAVAVAEGVRRFVEWYREYYKC